MKKGLTALLLLSFIISFAKQTIDDRLFMLMKKENFEEAISYAKIQLQLLPKGTPKYERKAPSYLLGLGIIYKKVGDIKQAEQQFKEAHEIYLNRKSLGKKPRYIDLDTEDELASLYLYMGNYSSAENILIENIEMRKKRFGRNNPVRYRSYLPYGMLLMKQKDYQNAYNHLKEYILYIKNSNHATKFEINRMADTYSILSDLKLLTGDTLRALDFAKKNERFQRHLWTWREAGNNTVKRIHALSKLAHCYLLVGDMHNAKMSVEKSKTLYAQFFHTDTHYKISILENEARIAFRENAFDKAMTKIDSACVLQIENINHNFNFLSEYEKENSYLEIKSTFDLFNSIFLEGILSQKITRESHWLNSFFNYETATKGLIINNSNKVIAKLNSEDNSEAKKIYRKLITAKNEYANTLSSSDYNEAESKLNTLEITIAELEKEIRTLIKIKNQEPYSIELIKNQLQMDEAYVEIVRTTRFDSSTPYYLILGINEAVNIEAIPGDRLEGRNLKYYKNTKAVKLTDKESYGVYYQPLLNQLKEGTKKVFINPDGAYNLVNLSNIYNPTTKKYLIEEIEIINLTSTGSFFDKQHIKEDFNTLTLFGNPIFNSQNKDANQRGLRGLVRGNLSNLPGTGIEVDKISSIAKENNLSIERHTLENATEAQIKEIDSPDILHIATHGFFDSKLTYGIAMMNSGILFTEFSGKDTTNEDGVFTSYEASCLQLEKTKLVVLSACETGKGDLRFGEGVFGLQRSFIVAGVDNIIMSMWKVDDNATQELMISFYSNLFDGSTVQQAFSAAQLDLKNKYPEPYYWGAFKLLGK